MTTVITQGDGYARDNTLIRYLDNITAPLLSYTYCHRLQMFYTRYYIRYNNTISGLHQAPDVHLNLCVQ